MFKNGIKHAAIGIARLNETIDDVLPDLAGGWGTGFIGRVPDGFEVLPICDDCLLTMARAVEQRLGQRVGMAGTLCRLFGRGCVGQAMNKKHEQVDDGDVGCRAFLYIDESDFN